jgi:endonuclease YncB( thermonuclease family)
MISMLRAILACLTLASAVLAAAPADIAGKVVGVHDGDTITILKADKAQVKVRLNGIDAPEAKQAFGAKAKAALSALVFGKAVIVHPTGQDLYRRKLGRVVVEGNDVNLQMVRDGFAWHYAKFSKDAALARAQAEAKAAKRGLWIDAAPVPPWEFRAPKAGEILPAGFYWRGLGHFTKLPQSVLALQPQF